MNNLTPEHLVTVTQGATPLQIVILILLGVIALCFTFWLVKWVIDLKMGTLPNDISKIRESMATLQADLNKIEAQLWSPNDVQREIKAALMEHVEKCPFHQDR